jgi:DNA helicase IV
MGKETILFEARLHVEKVRKAIIAGIGKTKDALKRSKERFASLPEGDKIVERRVMKYNEKREGELAHLEGSPYFVRCDVIWEKEEEVQRLYFGKFGFNEEDIYSWITPASSMRFENPGNVEYMRPDGKKQKAELVRKDQYMIVGGEIKFLATEQNGKARELVYQEYFSNRKTGFVLPEIVAQMEKAQDQVIRAHHAGPFLISGPAGSGKTTLALHRVAYLVQSPDLAKTYSSDSIIVFVQDNGTKEYFSHLLPELGIDDVLITTFSEWALSILDLKLGYTIRYGQTEGEKDAYEFAKLRALRNSLTTSFAKSRAFAILEETYFPYFDSKQKKLFQKQKGDKVLDRLDLSLLLEAYRQSNEGLGTIKNQYIEMKNGLIRKKRGFVPFEYSLAVVDEFQNYLPEQLRLINSCINRQIRSVLYVGDMAQQVQLGTMRDWGQIGEHIHDERKVVLHKVYRNTQNILRYIRTLGYDIEIPEGIKEGEKVGEYIFANADEEIWHIEKVITKNDFDSVGILAKEENYLDDFKRAFGKNDRVHAMTMNEAQGVEFDMVFLVGIDKHIFEVFSDGVPQELVEEKRRINKDLLYVALTRAISQLHVLGRERLSKAPDA